MAITTLVEQYQAKQGEVWGHRIRVVTYRLSEKYVCLIENLDVGAAICRVTGATREEALTTGLSTARDLIGKYNGPSNPESTLPDSDLTDSDVHVDKIVMNVEGVDVAYTIAEFNQLPAIDRMSQVLKGKIVFFSSTGESIPPAQAIEMLRKVA